MNFCRISTLLIISFFTSGIMAAIIISNFEPMAFAADNCDTTSTCVNIGTASDIQNNNCIRNSLCVNFAPGSPNTQNNNCDTTNLCSNIGSGGSTSQNNNCRITSLCQNVDNGGSIPRILIVRSLLYARM